MLFTFRASRVIYVYKKTHNTEDEEMRKPWNNETLRAWMIKTNFPEYEDCGHFGTVIYNGVFTTLSFIHKKGAEEYAIISSVRECHKNCFKHHPKMVKSVTKSEGNLLWKAIKSTEWTSRNHIICYDLGKALDKLPANSTLKAKFVGA